MSLPCELYANYMSLEKNQSKNIIENVKNLQGLEFYFMLPLKCVTKKFFSTYIYMNKHCHYCSGPNDFGVSKKGKFWVHSLKNIF